MAEKIDKKFNIPGFFMDVLKKADIGISIINKSRKIMHIDGVMKDLFPNSEGKKCHEVFFNNKTICDECVNFRDANKEKIVKRKDVEIADKYFDITCTRITDENGKEYIMNIYLDVTERKKMENEMAESEAKYKSLIENSNDAIYLLRGKNFEIINKKFEELLGVTQEETRSHDFNFMNHVSPKSRELIRQRTEKQKRGEKIPNRYEFTALTKEGKELEVEVSVSYIKHKGETFVQGILRDITDKKRDQRELRRKSEEILELSTPIIKVWNKILVLPLIGMVDSKRAAIIMENALSALSEKNAKLIIFDITGVATVDTQVANHLLKTIKSIKLIGGECIITGIKPSIAQTIVHLGVDLSEINTKATLMDGLKYAMNYLGFKIVKG